VKVKRWHLIVFGVTVVQVGMIFRLQYRMERAKYVVNRMVEEMQRCGRVQLLSSREDVLQAMGQPTKEVEVPSVTGGMATRMYFQYSTLKVEHPPYIDVDHHFRKVVAIDCALAQHSLRQLIKSGQAQMPKEEALPTDSKRF
jgi:hypothetical protein